MTPAQETRRGRRDAADAKRRPRWLWARFERRPENSSEPTTSSGLPSRPALIAAARELEDRSEVLRQPIAVVRIRVSGASRVTNEQLRDIARLAESPLPAYTRLYEEARGDFVLLLPAAEAVDAIPVVADLKSEVAIGHNEGNRPIDVIAGISASYAGEPFLFELVAARAEQALADAEHQGGLAIVPSLKSETYGRTDPEAAADG